MRTTCSTPVPLAGNLHSKVLFVGEAPGAEEDSLGFPFVGASGKILQKACQNLGWDIWSSCVISNIVKCRPVGNRTPTPEEASTCYHRWLEKEISLIDPGIIILLGRTSQQLLLPNVSLSNGQTHVTSDNKVFAFLYHPSYWLRNGGMSFAEKQVIPALRQWYQFILAKGFSPRPTSILEGIYHPKEN